MKILVKESFMDPTFAVSGSVSLRSLRSFAAISSFIAAVSVARILRDPRLGFLILLFAICCLLSHSSFWRE
jgi:hypothetical protein